MERVAGLLECEGECECKCECEGKCESECEGERGEDIDDTCVREREEGESKEEEESDGDTREVRGEGERADEEGDESSSPLNESERRIVNKLSTSLSHELSENNCSQEPLQALTALLKQGWSSLTSLFLHPSILTLFNSCSFPWDRTVCLKRVELAHTCRKCSVSEEIRGLVGVVPSLEELVVGFRCVVSKEDADVLLQFISTHPRLSSLSIEGIRMDTQTCTRLLQHTRTHTRMRTLKLTMPPLKAGAQAKALLRTLQQLPLRTLFLHLQQIHKTHTHTLTHTLGTMHSLRDLTLIMGEGFPKDSDIFSSLSSLPSLSSLTLSADDLYKPSAHTLILALPRLTHVTHLTFTSLSMYGTHSSDSWSKLGTAIGAMPALTHISVPFFRQWEWLRLACSLSPSLRSFTVLQQGFSRVTLDPAFARVCAAMRGFDVFRLEARELMVNEEEDLAAVLAALARVKSVHMPAEVCVFPGEAGEEKCDFLIEVFDHHTPSEPIIETLNCPYTYTCSLLPAFSPCPSLTSLTLHSFTPTHRNITSLMRLPQLQTLSITFTEDLPTDALRLSLSSLSRLPHLTHLCVLWDGECELIEASVVRDLMVHGCVRELRLEGMPLSPAAVAEVLSPEAGLVSCRLVECMSSSAVLEEVVGCVRRRVGLKELEVSPALEGVCVVAEELERVCGLKGVKLSE